MYKASLVALLVASLAISFISAQSSVGNCQPFDALPQPTVDALAQAIKAQTFSSGKLKVLADFAANNTLGFTANATTTIISLFTFSSDQSEALDTISKFILGMNCVDAAKIIGVLTFSSDKIAVLKSIVNYVVDLKNNSAVIINAFTFSSDKADAQKIIDGAKPRSCLWGEITIDRFDFIVDTSGSMSTVFTAPDGRSYSRLQFVQHELYRVMNGTLAPSQKFNIIRFSDYASAWQPGVQPVTPANLANASSYVQGLSAGGGTYVLNAIRLSISDSQVHGVYLLSDGEPSDDPNTIINTAVQWGKPVNTIAFKAEDAGVAFLSQLAKATGGTFRAFK